MKKQLTQFLFTTFLLVLLTAGNVNAKDTEGMVVSGLENIIEPQLELEEWMINQSAWEKSTDTFYFEDYPEKRLTLENWMFDKNKWMALLPECPETGNENRLHLENWMTNDIYWN